MRLRLTDREAASFAAGLFGVEFDRLFDLRREEADEFYATIIPDTLSADAQQVMRQSFAGLLWSKQFYHFVIRDWLNGDPSQPPPPEERRTCKPSVDAPVYAPTSSRCPTSGNILQAPPGISPFTRCRWRWWTPSLPRNSSCSCCASGTCIPTGNSPPTSGRLAMSTRRSMPGPRGAFTRSRRSGAGAAIASFWSAFFRNCC